MAEVFKGRREDRRLMTGVGRYTADWDLPGQLYGVFLRADRAHALMRSVDATAARKHPGVISVITGADLANAGFKFPGTMVSYPGRGGQSVKVPQRPCLARDRVRFVGEEVALVVATSKLAAQDATELIAIDYEDLPVVAHPEDAVKAGAVQLYPDIQNNICFDYEYGNEAATDAVFAKAHHVTRLKIESQRICGNPMEPRAALVAYDAAADRYDVYTSNQGPTMFKPGLAYVSGVPPEKIRIMPLDVGGGFGLRSGSFPEHVVLMYAAKALGKPIKWVGSRFENFVTDPHGRAIVIEGELAMDQGGKFLAIRTNWLADQGAYLTAAGPLINTANGMLTLSGVYNIPVGYGRHRLMLTNTTPTGPYRGAGRPDMAYICERLVDQAALEMKIDRAEIRRRNFIPKAAFPFKNAAGAVYDSGDIEALINHALEASNWSSFEARRKQSSANGKYRGIGCATFIEPAGGGAAPKDQAAVRFEEGDKIALIAPITPHGQGHETAFPEIVARVLGVPPESITLRGLDPHHSIPLMGNGVVGSRTAMHYGSALKLAAGEVVKKGLELASRKLEAAPDDIEFKNGRYTIKGTGRSVGLFDLAREHRPDASHPLNANGEWTLSRSFPSGAHVAEVEIDPATGMVDIIQYTAVDDCGDIINHTLVEGQLHGSVLQGVGQVLGEIGYYDRSNGQFLTGTFMDYYMPRAGLVRNLQGHELNVRSPTNPLGVKGVGEAGTTGSLPTVVNAIVDALKPLGIQHIDMPCTPARVWEAIQAAQKH
ncbi:MAG: xanthine dehydrogenase family protein molybdopterin-binding subunit [Betaproteobacteria bacterium]|nr:xanthine dehydrogenase family protein molybdopterin-binding subunit [Betaproteobacteria bacterium]